MSAIKIVFLVKIRGDLICLFFFLIKPYMNLFLKNVVILALLILTLPTLAQYDNRNSTISSSLSSQQVNIQSKIDPPTEDFCKWQASLGVTGAFGEGATSTTLSFSHLCGFGNYQRFRLGYGVRLSSFFGTDRAFTAVPPALASEENPDGFVTEKVNLTPLI